MGKGGGVTFEGEATIVLTEWRHHFDYLRFNAGRHPCFCAYMKINARS
jgi:hypothetical protein